MKKNPVPIATRPKVRIPLYRLRVVEMRTRRDEKHRPGSARWKELSQEG